MGYTKVGLVKTENVNIHTAARDPLATDDASSSSNGVTTSIAVGDRWLNTNTNNVYICTDNTDGAAVWRPASPGKVLLKKTLTVDPLLPIPLDTPVDLGLNIPAGARITHFFLVPTVELDSSSNAAVPRIDVYDLGLSVLNTDDGNYAPLYTASVSGNHYQVDVLKESATLDGSAVLATNSAPLSENSTVALTVTSTNPGEVLDVGSVDIYVEYLLA